MENDGEHWTARSTCPNESDVPASIAQNPAIPARRAPGTTLFRPVSQRDFRDSVAALRVTTMTEQKTQRAVKWYPPAYDIRVEDVPIPRSVADPTDLRGETSKLTA